MIKLISCFMFLCVLFSCSTTNNAKNNSTLSLDQAYEMMQGDFNSFEQASIDTNYYDITLRMYPIWINGENERWLYVEQAVSSMENKPYRQRIYQLSMNGEGILESKVYRIQDEEKFIGKWRTPEFFDRFSRDILVEREGCTVYLTPFINYLEGETKDKACKSTLRGAAYATSKVKITKESIISWDQGYDEMDKQVWGATEGGYIFKKIK